MKMKSLTAQPTLLLEDIFRKLHSAIKKLLRRCLFKTGQLPAEHKVFSKLQTPKRSFSSHLLRPMSVTFMPLRGQK